MSGYAEPQVLAHQTWKVFGLNEDKLRAMGLGSSVGVYELGKKDWLWRKTFDENTLDEGYLCIKGDSLYLLVHGKHLACLIRTSHSDPVPPSKHRLTAFNRGSGDVIWQVELPGEPIADGVSIGRDGSVLVRLLDGGLASVGVK